MRAAPKSASLLCLGLALGLLTGCANLAPAYQRPDLPTPASVDGRPPAVQTVAPLDWRQLVTDARLEQAIALALENNRDLRIAALNISKARAQYRITDAAAYPAISASLGETATGSAGTVTRKYSAGVGFTSYELDFFGRINNLSDAALQSFLATEATQRSVRASLVAEVANAWLTLAANQDLLGLARETAGTRERTLDLIRRQQALGGTSKLTLAQAEAAMEAARGDVANYASLVEQARNALNLLAGAVVPEEALPTRDAVGGRTGAALLALTEVPAGLSSEVLLQRPDILAAEHTLVASYADIGAARAAFFPTITLTGSAGAASAGLGSLFQAGAGAWSFVPMLSLPIFSAGKLQASLAVAETSRDIQVATYEKAVQTAFREVADALAERAAMAERMAAQQAEVDAYATSLRLSTERYRAGADSYLSVLDSQRSLYAGQKSLIGLQLAEQANRVALFKALGGS